MSSSPSTNMIGVVTLSEYITGERDRNSCGLWNGVSRNQVGRKSVKSAVYQKPSQLATSRCDTAAAKRCVWPTVQSVSKPPPEPPVTPSLVESTQPRLINESTAIIRSL